MRNKNLIIIAFITMLFVLFAIPVQAQNITIANPGGTMERDIIVYWANGTDITCGTVFYGTYNTTSTISLDGSTDYILVLKPQTSVPWEDPKDFLDAVIVFLGRNLLPIVVLIFLAGLLLSRRH